MFKLAGTIPPPDVNEVVSYDTNIYDGEEYFEWLFRAYRALGDLEHARGAIAKGIIANPLSPAFRQRCVEFGVPLTTAMAHRDGVQLQPVNGKGCQ